MRKIAFLLIPFMFLIIPLVSQGEEKVADKPAVYAVMMYADWCGSCKSLDPKVVQARKDANLDGQDVLFVTLDLTDDTTKLQAEMMAAVLGISEIYETNAGKTGFMLLINSESGEKLARITNKLDSSDIATRIQESVKALKS